MPTQPIHPATILANPAAAILAAAASAPNPSTVDEDVESVVEHLLKLGKKYDFRVDEDCVRDSIEETAELLRITLTEEQAVKACDLALVRQGAGT